MTLSLRTRLTLWYSAFVLLIVLVFSTSMLWLYWQLLLKESDESLAALSITAANVVSSELTEQSTLAEASREMAAVVRHPDYVVGVLDGEGRPVSALPISLSTPPRLERDTRKITATVTDPEGKRWRLMLRAGESNGQRFTVMIAASLGEITEHWHRLLDAFAIGIPFVFGLAAIGGWALGRRGLRPLDAIATQAQSITPQRPEARLAVVNAGPELAAVTVAFNRVLDQLHASLATQRRFMADASHELRTPVSIMRTAADVTLSQNRRDEVEYRDALGTISQQTFRLTRLVDDMLVLARADAGGHPVVRAEVDLDALVEECVGELAARAATKNIRLTSHLEPVCVTADAALLRRLFSNILSNAVTYTPDGGTINVTMLPRQGAVSVNVADTGPGIPAADHDRVFERFVRLDPARAEGGAGLGLSIARWVAEVHGGRVELLTSGPDGSIFSAMIPL